MIGSQANGRPISRIKGSGGKERWSRKQKRAKTMEWRRENKREKMKIPHRSMRPKQFRNLSEL